MSNEAVAAPTKLLAVPVARVQGRWLVLAHVILVGTYVLCLVLFAAGLFVRFEIDFLPCAVNPARDVWPVCEAYKAASREIGLSPTFAAASLLALRVVATLPYFALGVLIVWRRSDEIRILLLATLLATLAATGTWVVPLWDWAQFAYPILRVPSQFVRALLLCGFLFGYLFPDGHFVPAWTRWLAILCIPLAFCSSFLKGSPLDFYSWPFPLPQAILLILAGTSVYAMVYRYRRVAGSVQRQQIKWIVAGGSLLFLVWFLDFGVLDLYPSATGDAVPFTMKQWVVRNLLQETASYLTQLLFVIAVGLAVFRYRLYDVDLIVRRTLVYGPLTVALALGYWGSVVLLQSLFRLLTGQSSDLAIIASTLGIAALFQPLRRRIHDAIDRRFYRRTYDATQVLAAFGANLRDEVDLDHLTAVLLAVVDETIQPARSFLWLRQGEPQRAQRPGTEKGSP